MFSVVIPLYNKQEHIKSTIESVLAQTFKDFEVVIVDDGSTDRSVEVIHKNFNDPRIRILSQRNAGVSAARNTGIENAAHEYVAFLDADDEWKPDYLASKATLIEKYPDAIVYASNYEFLKPNGSLTLPLIRRLPFEGKDGKLTNYFEVASHSDPPLWTSAIVVKRKALDDISFPVGMKSGEDLLTWARLAAKGEIVWSKEPEAIYHQGFSNPRPPEEVDLIGRELEDLARKQPFSTGIDSYVAFWYKMRMCRCLAHKMWSKSLQAFTKSLQYNPLQAKIYLSIVKYTLKSFDKS